MCPMFIRYPPIPGPSALGIDESVFQIPKTLPLSSSGVRSFMSAVSSGLAMFMSVFLIIKSVRAVVRLLVVAISIRSVVADPCSIVIVLTLLLSIFDASGDESVPSASVAFEIA